MLSTVPNKTERRRRILGLAVSAALAFTLLPPVDEVAVAAPMPDPAPAPADARWVEPTGTGVVRPDFVSARVTARASGQRVEVLSERSETQRSWVNPDGTIASELTGGPVRFKDAAATTTDGWRDVDLTLRKNLDGSVSPAGVPGTLVLTGGGKGSATDQLVLSEAIGAGKVAVGSGLGMDLPEPKLDGPKATYTDVLPGVDLTVEVRPAGFEQLWVVKSKVGLVALTTNRAVFGGAFSSTMSVSGMSASPAEGGAVEFLTDKGKRAGLLAAPTMWDAKTDPVTREPANRVEAKFGLKADGASVKVGQKVSGKLGFQVIPDAVWLADPAREFPITIDPTYAASTADIMYDAFVEDTWTSDWSADPKLKFGDNGAGLMARTYMAIYTQPLWGKKITSASLDLYGTYVRTCTPKGWSSWNSGLPSTSTRWTNQPTIGAKFATSTQAKGYQASCPNGTVSIDMTAQAQTWADDNSQQFRGMVLRGDSETDPLFWKEFASSETATPPVLRYTYNRAPGGMATPTIASTVAYTPAGASAPILYTSDTKPNVSGVVADPDGDTVWGKFYAKTNQADSTDASYCMSPTAVASGTTASCEMATTLTSNSRVWVRTRGYDSRNFGPYSGFVELRIAATKPTVPVISCPAPNTSGAWNTTAPAAALSCTVTAVGTGYSAPSTIRYSVDNNATFTDAPITQSSSAATAKTTVTISAAAGGHNIRAYAVSPTGIQSNLTTFWTGWVSPSLLAPVNDPQVTTTDKVTINAAGPPKGASTLPTAKTQWRVSGNASASGWVDAPAANTLAVTDLGGQSVVTGLFDTTTVNGLADGAPITVNPRTTTLLDVRVCLTYTSGVQCTPQATVQKVPHAFGSGFPVADAGPGQVSLWTGELQVDDFDADLATPTGSLSVSRSHTSFPGPTAVQNGVFGPGWTASFDGDGSGAGGDELVDATTVDGTLAVVDGEGSAWVFKTPMTGARRTDAVIPTGAYKPADTDTKTAGVKLKVSGTGALTVASLTGDDGVVTKYQVTAAPPVNAPATFKTVEVSEPATADKTTYSYDAAGRVTAISATLPDGVSTCVAGTATNGCRVLKISYSTTTTATSTTPGDFQNQVKKITAQVNTDADRELAAYKYDLSGLLVDAKDSRTGLATSYGWTGTGTTLRLATITPPGLPAYTFTYDANRLKSVTRPNPATAGGGTAQLAAYVYNVPVAGTIKDLPDMGVEVTKWNQASTPTTVQAVFGPDKPITTTPTVGSDDWTYADLQLTDPNGYTVNTATYGAGDWQLTAADYDAQDNIIRAWDERAVKALRAGNYEAGASGRLASLTVYNDDISIAGTVVTQAGTLVTDTYGPAHQVAAANSETADGTALLRTHLKTIYDQGAPYSGINPDSDQPYRLPTKTVTTAETTDGTVDSTLAVNLAGYEAIMANDPTGWALGQPTTSTTVMNADGTTSPADITSKTRYDNRGRTIETRQPKSNGSDAGTRITTYYTAGTSSVTGCGSKPAWAGMVCQVGPAAQPAGQTMPVTKTTSYTWDGQAATTVDASGPVTSTNTTTYDTQDRPTTTTTSVSGLASSTAVPPVTTTYDANTGAPTGTTSTAGATAATYDGWGRQLTYSNTPAAQSADTATTTYNAIGQVTSVVDGNGATAYTYDTTDAAGLAERRGLPTSVKVKITNGSEYESTGAYDEAGDLVLERLPGKINQRTTIDAAGDQTEFTYYGQAVNPDTNTLQDDQPWLGWTTISNAASQTTREWTPSSGAGYTGELGATAIASDRNYTYDQGGRLTQVQDRTGNPDATVCATRTYTFDTNGNRTSQADIPSDSSGGCATGGNNVTHTYDTADRPTTGGNGTGSYVYDQLGRQTTIPASDAPKPSDGDINLSYYDTDAAKTITQNKVTNSFTLDGAGRRLDQTTTGGTNNTLVRHYTNSDDNPTWTIDTTGGVTTTTRYNELIDGDLGLTLTTASGTTKAELDLATPRGDTAATITLPTGANGPTGTAANNIKNWTDYTEYGAPKQTVISAPGGVTGVGYGWLGAKQRASVDNGLILMGQRLYNRSTALFTTTDPVQNGGDTIYGYPTDPVQMQDLDGSFWGIAARALCRYACRPLFRRAIRPASRIIYRKVLRPAGSWVARKAKSGWHAYRNRKNMRLYHTKDGGWSYRVNRNFRIDRHTIRSVDGGHRKYLHFHLRTKKVGIGQHRLFWPVHGRWRYK